MKKLRTIKGKKYLYKSVRVGKKVKGIYLGKKLNYWDKPNFWNIMYMNIICIIIAAICVIKLWYELLPSLMLPFLVIIILNIRLIINKLK